jgi:hypothetical protein
MGPGLGQEIDPAAHCYWASLVHFATAEPPLVYQYSFDVPASVSILPFVRVPDKANESPKKRSKVHVFRNDSNKSKLHSLKIKNRFNSGNNYYNSA